jgi:Calcineurin-like phosphoesterase
VNRRRQLVSAALLIASIGACPASSLGQAVAKVPAKAAYSKSGDWVFAVSGDSRNCGDVVMPAIAQGVKRSGAAFYWHLGDLRRISDVDEDIRHQPEYVSKPLTKAEYLDMAWNDFIQNQIVPFGEIPFYLGIGNHETIPPKDHAAFLAQFSTQLDLSNLRAQRLLDDPADLQPKSYYHWIERGVDFINLDNATQFQFDADQLSWFEKVLRSDSADAKIRTIVVGMHEALPESLSKDHAMDQSNGGTETGLRVYADLLKAQNEDHKRVYVLASHSHYFMNGAFNTDYWRRHGGILPGWIVGTAGAVRYALPPESGAAREALTNVYGFLAGTVGSQGRIRFVFHPLDEADVPAAISARYTPEFVHWCFAENSQAH